MGIVSTLTIGSIVHSIYALTADPLQDAKDHLAGRFGTDAWDSASANDRKKALVSAQRWLDRQRWAGTPTDVVSPQPLEHPRAGLTDCNGTSVLDSVVAQEIVEAQFELALIVLEDSDAQDAAGQGSNVKRVKAGSAEVEFHRNTVGTSVDTNLPAIAHALVSCFFGGNSLGVPHISGAGTASVFDLDDRSGLNTPGLS